MGRRLFEIINPFVQSWVSGNNEIDELVKNVISSLSCKYASLKNKSTGTKTKISRQKTGCGYLLAESGDLGKCEKQDVERHIGWVHEVMVH